MRSEVWLHKSLEGFDSARSFRTVGVALKINLEPDYSP